MSKPSSSAFYICIFLAVAVFAVYGKAMENDFVHYDDYDYVVNNGDIQKGFTTESIRWAFGTHASNWHPLTWLSHMLDYRFFGMDPKGHHLTNVLIHLANTVLLFLLLNRMTGALWRSACVAALFGVHPLHVESVAWIAERKDVLCALFWILTTWAYVRYAERPGASRYFWVVLCFALGLMAKPMIVTLPFTLLLLDAWPLKRLPGGRSRWPAKSGLLWEKLPLFALAAVSCAVTMSAQGRARSLLDFDTRVTNALVSYATYLVKTVWPANLAVFYPHPLDALPQWKVAGAAIFLIGVTVQVIRYWRRFPYLAVGWFWYLGTLVPVIGVVQVGGQALADRYTYMPLIGFFIIVSWGGRDLADCWRVPKALLGFLAGGLIVSLIAVSSLQVGHWRDSGKLFEHAVNSTSGNYLAHSRLGYYLKTLGRVEAGAAHLIESVRIKQDHAPAFFDLGNALSWLSKPDEALANFAIAVEINPAYLDAYINMGSVLLEQKKYDAAAKTFKKALVINPRSRQAYSKLGVISIKKGNYNEAVTHLTQALNLWSGFADAHNNLGFALAALGKPEEAEPHFLQAIGLKPGFAKAHFNLANLLAGQGQLEAAAAHYSQAVVADAVMVEAHHNLGVALVRLGRLSEAAGAFATALELQPDFAPSRRAAEDLSRRDPERKDAIKRR